MATDGLTHCPVELEIAAGAKKDGDVPTVPKMVHIANCPGLAASSSYATQAWPPLSETRGFLAWAAFGVRSPVADMARVGTDNMAPKMCVPVESLAVDSQATKRLPVLVKTMSGL
jgi:hypothetical protein